MAELRGDPTYKGDAPIDNVDSLSIGFYIARGVSWYPSGTAGFGSLFVLPGYRTQIFIDVSGRVAIRVRSNNVWCGWMVYSL